MSLLEQTDKMIDAIFGDAPTDAVFTPEEREPAAPATTFPPRRWKMQCEHCSNGGADDLFLLACHITECPDTEAKAPKVWERYANKKLATLKIFAPNIMPIEHGAYQCPHCGWEFNDERALYAHMLYEHTRNELRPLAGMIVQLHNKYARQLDQIIRKYRNLHA